MDSANTKVDYATDQEKITSIIEDAFPKTNFKKDLGNPQSDGNRLGFRIFYLWVWPIIAINNIRNLINRMDFVQPYVSGNNDFVKTGFKFFITKSIISACYCACCF